MSDHKTRKGLLWGLEIMLGFFFSLITRSLQLPSPPAPSLILRRFHSFLSIATLYLHHHFVPELAVQFPNWLQFSNLQPLQFMCPATLKKKLSEIYIWSYCPSVANRMKPNSVAWAPGPGLGLPGFLAMYFLPAPRHSCPCTSWLHLEPLFTLLPSWEMFLLLDRQRILLLSKVGN